MSGGQRWLIAGIFCLLLPIALTFYLTSNTIKSTNEVKNHKPELPSPKRRPKIGCATGIVVMLLCIPFTFANASTSSNTNTATTQQAKCQDGMYSKSGGVSGSCSYHGGNLRPLYSH